MRLGSSIWNWFADAAFSILGTSPAGMGSGTLWGTASSVSEILSILSATLVTIFALIDFLQNTADIRHGVTMEGVLLGGTGGAGTFGFAAMVQLVLGVVLITGSVKAVDALIRRAVGV